MQFQVPQFINREPRIVGPFTFRQSLYLGVAIGVGFIFYLMQNFLLLVIWGVLGGSLAVALAFSKAGGRSFSAVVVDFFKFSFSSKKYLWKEKQSIAFAPRPQQPISAPIGMIKTKQEVGLVKESRLKNLATEVQTRK